jgi:hypothetical protein
MRANVILILSAALALTVPPETGVNVLISWGLAEQA